MAMMVESGNFSVLIFDLDQGHMAHIGPGAFVSLHLPHRLLDTLDRVGVGLELFWIRCGLAINRVVWNPTTSSIGVIGVEYLDDRRGWSAQLHCGFNLFAFDEHKLID